MERRDTTPDGSLGRYFKSVSRIEMMSFEEETATAREWLQTGKQELADKLVGSNLRFVIKVALEYRNYGFPILDLIQEGNLGLVRAVKSFDPDKGFRLISYAVWWIRAYIQEYILKNWSLVRIGTTQLQRRLFNNMQSSQKRLHAMMGTDEARRQREALAESVRGTVRDVEDMERRLYSRDVSLDATADSESGTGLHDRLASPWDGAEQLLGDEEAKSIRESELGKALATLEDRERMIVVSRHLDENSVTLRELGESLGISKERVRQLENRALRNLRSALERTLVVAQLV